MKKNVNYVIDLSGTAFTGESESLDQKIVNLTTPDSKGCLKCVNHKLEIEFINKGELKLFSACLKDLDITSKFKVGCPKFKSRNDL